MKLERQMDLLERWRLRKVLPWGRGRLFDVACGYNLVHHCAGPGVGVDAHPWPGCDLIIRDAAELPFSDGSFDTVTVLAALDHFPDRSAALREIHRVLQAGGRFLFAMIGSLTRIVAHIIFRQDEEKRGGLGDGEKVGLRRSEIVSLLQSAGFVLLRRIPFQFGLNAVYVAGKRALDTLTGSGIVSRASASRT
jgi:SAM-dependent methyltransferase